MTEAEEYFGEARAAFAMTSASGVVSRRLSIGGSSIEFRFSSAEMASRLLESMAQLPTTEIEPELVVEAFDDATATATGTGRMPPLPWPSDQIGPLGNIRDLRSEHVRIVFEAAYSSVSMIDLATNVGLFWLPDGGKMHYRQSAFPFRQILAWWFARRGAHLAHVAAVHRGGDHAVLLPGRGGRGKSSTALSCLIDGLSYLGDDFCLLEVGPSGAPGIVHPLYSVAKLWQAGLDRLPELSPCVINRPTDDDPKHSVALARKFADSLTPRGVPVGLIAVPELTNEVRSRTEPCSRGHALRALAPTSLLSLADAGNLAMSQLAEVVRGVPCHRLLLGTERRGVVDAVRSLLP